MYLLSKEEKEIKNGFLSKYSDVINTLTYPKNISSVNMESIGLELIDNDVEDMIACNIVLEEREEYSISERATSIFHGINKNNYTKYMDTSEIIQKAINNLLISDLDDEYISKLREVLNDWLSVALPENIDLEFFVQERKFNSNYNKIARNIFLYFEIYAIAMEDKSSENRKEEPLVKIKEKPVIKEKEKIQEVKETKKVNIKDKPIIKYKPITGNELYAGEMKTFRVE